MAFYRVTILAFVTVDAEDEGHARDVVRDVLENDRLICVEVAYSKAKEGMK